MDKIRALGELIARRKILSSVIAVILIAALVGLRIYLKDSAGHPSDPIQRGQIVDAVYGIGTVTANNRVSINPLVGTTVRHSYVREGDKVKKGMPLVMTDDGNTYRAPFDGIANYYPYHPGENTYTTMPMLVFTDMSDRYIVVSMEQQGALRVKVGQDARLSFDSLRDRTFRGKVAAVYSYNNNFLARIDAVDLPDSVLPDMTCDVAIVIEIHPHALVIPVVAFDNGKVWVKRGSGLPKITPVQLGVIDGLMAEVISGDVQVGDRLMLREQVSL